MMKLFNKRNLIQKLNQLIFSFLCLFLLVSSSSSQSNETKSNQQKSQNQQENQAKSEILKWQTISEQLTKDIINDTKSDYPERPLILAKLSGFWWKNDEDSAQKWLKTAVNEVTFDKLNETNTQKAERMRVAGELIKLVMPKDKFLAEKLISYVTKEASESGSNLQNADEFIKTALQIVDENPTSAKMLGTLSLKYGQSYQLFRLIRELNLKNEVLAENLFGEALLSAERNKNNDTTVGLISSLYNVVFRQYKGKSLSENSKKNYLNVLFNLVSADTDFSCSYLSTASSLISSYENYFPEKAIAIRQKTTSCQNLDKGIANSINSNLSNDQPETVDELISAAKETEDDFLKSSYYRQAIKKLFNSKDFEQIFSVLEDMDEEEKKVFGEDAWNSWWIETALKASALSIKNDNLSGAYRIINKTPKKLRPSIQSGLAKEFKDEDKALAIQMLDSARKDLDTFEINSKDKAAFLIYLVKQYAEIAPYETMNVFNEIITAVNKADAENPENARVKDFAPFSDSILIPILILEENEFSTMKLLSEIDSTNSRIRFRLGFLEQSLEKLNQAKMQLKKTLKAK